MLTRHELHQMIDALPEAELQVLARVAEGLKLTARPAARPVLTPSPPMQPPQRAPLAHQYSEMIRKQADNSESLLRKVMFTPLSDLLSWVNQPPAAPEASDVPDVPAAPESEASSVSLTAQHQSV
ncbi:MAG: hypothetical protein IGS03_18430 [Candidatus Sericytochromatia bacterium]|nr:hypothetical protein [Candidatus Sericytochromatia bacterium]